MTNYTGYGKLNTLLDELEELQQSAQFRANNLLESEEYRIRAQASADAYGFCKLRLITLGRKQ
jgi:hypothetical protein